MDGDNQEAYKEVLPYQWAARHASLTVYLQHILACLYKEQMPPYMIFAWYAKPRVVPVKSLEVKTTPRQTSFSGREVALFSNPCAEVIDDGNK